MNLNGKLIKKLSPYLKVIIPLLSIIWLVAQINSKSFDSCSFEELFSQKELGDYILFSIAVSLLFLNWGIESYKWFLLINTMEKISYLKSYRAVFSGVSVSILFPFRTGEYLGRISYLKRKLEGVLLTVLGSMTQMVATFGFGLWGLFYINGEISIDEELYWITGGIIVILPLFYLFFPNFVKGTKLAQKGLKWFKLFKRVNDRRIIIKVQVLSLVRYAVFAFQYWIFLRFFGVNMELFPILAAVTVMYLSLTIVPVNQVLELGSTRSLMLIPLLSVFTSYQSSYDCYVVIASFVIWFVNVVTPAVVGGFLLMFKKQD